MDVLMAPQYDMIKTTASVAYQFNDKDARTLVALLTGRAALVEDGVAGRSVAFRLNGQCYVATYRIAAEWWDRRAGMAWGTRMAGITDVHIERIGKTP